MNRNRIRFALAVILCGALAFSLASPASAFVVIARQASPTSPVVQAHWFPSEFPLESIIAPGNADKPSATALASVLASGEEWENITTSFFAYGGTEYTGAGGELVPALANDGQNSVFFDGPGTNFPTAGVIAFVRSIIDASDGHTLDADMVFNDRDFWWSTSAALEVPPAGQSSVDLQSVATHEYGHYFSLDHTSVLGCTMIPFIQNNISQRTLELDDRQGNASVYPEANFATDFGSISGTVTNGFTGSAVFGAHVEALLIATGGNPANTISILSGELTLRNGQGDWTIRGLPPGDYAVRIVPLDGVNTTATDANIGGPYAGIDIGFEPEFWNGASESADGFTDNANAFTPITVTAGGAVTAIDIQTNTYAGRVNIAQYGQFENIVTFTTAGWLGVRFDPPFDAPYTIENIQFPSALLFSGTTARFTSARLCVMDPATGLPDLANPLVSISPFNGNVNGVNTVPVNLPGVVGQTYFWMLQFPAGANNQPNFPFVRMDFVTMETGQYLNSYLMPNAGGANLLLDRNIVASMRCQTDPSEVGINPTAGLGGNRKSAFTEFNYRKPGDARMDNFALPHNSLDAVELVARTPFAPGNWVTVASAGSGAGSVKLNPTPAGVLIYATRALDKNGNRSLNSNVVYTGVAEGADEPNGGAKTEATPVTLPVVNRAEAIGMAGDQDWFAFTATPGSQLLLTANHVGTLDGRNDPDLCMFLYDKSGEIVAFNDDFTGLNPRIVFDVPPAPGNGQGAKDPRQFSVRVESFNGSLLLEPNGSPRVATPATYRFDASATAPAAAASFARGLDPEKFHFALSGRTSSVAKLLYIIPRNAGSQDVRLKVYDVSGRLVRTLVNGPQNPGPYPVLWDGRDDDGRNVGSGNYYARLSVGSLYQENSKITLVK